MRITSPYIHTSHTAIPWLDVELNSPPHSDCTVYRLTTAMLASELRQAWRQVHIGTLRIGQGDMRVCMRNHESTYKSGLAWDGFLLSRVCPASLDLYDSD